MDAKAKSFTFLANEGLVRIPFFQRGYVWGKDNWDDLLEDLSDFKKGHFLGSLILKQQSVSTGESKEVLVIDGQQRLTTLSILIKALFDSFSPELKKNCEMSLRSHLFYKRYQTDSDFVVKIQHSQVDSEAYKKVVRYEIEENGLYKDWDQTNRILKCYNHFREKLDEKSEEERKRVFNGIFDPENKMLVVIDLAENDNEQTIFDTINSSGVRLSSSDIVKNSLFQKAIQLLTQDKAIELYNSTWKKIFLSEDEIIEFWETKRPTGRLLRDNVEILLHAIAVIKGFYDPDKHKLEDLAKLYKTQINEYRSGEDLKAFVKEITVYAGIYKEYMPALTVDTQYSFDNKLQRLLHVLDVLQISTFHPLILFLFKTKEKDQEGLYQELLNLEKFVLRRVIANEETKSFNKFCKEFIESPDSLIARIKETSDADVIRGLKDISNKHAALLLFWVELQRRSQGQKFDIKELKYDYSLEHIMPQKWEEYWTDLPEKKSADDKILSLEASKSDRYLKIYWIGNMTLLTSSLNSSLRNYVFEKKINGDGKKKGIKSYANLSITKDDIVIPYENGITGWNEENIIKRTDQLEGEILSIWGMGDENQVEDLTTDDISSVKKVVHSEITDQVFYIKAKGIHAKGIKVADGFQVLAGSKAVNTETPTYPSNYKKVKNELLEGGILKTSEDSYIFTQDYLFSSPSLAAGIVQGRAATGPGDWKSREGETLKEFLEN